jgi:hypothetical protein
MLIMAVDQPHGTAAEALKTARHWATGNWKRMRSSVTEVLKFSSKILKMREIANKFRLSFSYTVAC